MTKSDIINKGKGLKNKKLKILIAEDNGINQLYLRNFLRNHGFNVDTAFNGMEVIEKYNSNEYDLILMDGHMPKLDGFEATKIIRKKEQEKNIHTPIIAITGYAFIGDEERFIEAGMDDYIKKPIDESLLMDIIKKHTSK